MSGFKPLKCPPGCVYAMHSGMLRHCGYILITGHMRGCEPGYGCTRYSRDIRKTEDFFIKRPRKSCEICGNMFPPRNVRSKYCSKACAKEAERRTHRAYEARARAERALQRVATCKICGKPFFAYSSRSVLCSPECRKAANRGQQSGLTKQVKKQEAEEKHDRQRTD